MVVQLIPPAAPWVFEAALTRCCFENSWFFSGGGSSYED
jgi:hypothetical protein